MVIAVILIFIISFIMALLSLKKELKKNKEFRFIKRELKKGVAIFVRD